MDISEENYYKILNVPENSDISVVKKAYKKLVVIYHPDKNHSVDP